MLLSNINTHDVSVRTRCTVLQAEWKRRGGQHKLNFSLFLSLTAVESNADGKNGIMVEVACVAIHKFSI